MCGISFIYYNNDKSPSAAALTAMVNALYHRGPDAQAQMIIGPAGLGHTRLSIVDISTGGQPMTTDDGRFTIVFNGEIYNYAPLRDELLQQGVMFHTHSDTEVILQLFSRNGKDCVSRLRGMFSFVIYDQQTKCLFIARDRFGIKPLFYHWNGTTLVGASEMKAIFASGLITPEFNLQTLRNYFTYQFNVTPYTCFKDVIQLPPGYTLSIEQNGEPVLHQYWDINYPVEGDHEELDDQQWINKFEQALDGAAISHMIGDVPIGAYLSGGIDSSTTAYLLNKHYPQAVQTFTMRFTNPNSDESAISRSTAAHLSVPNHELIVDDNREGGFLDILEQALYHVEQPQRLALEVPLFMLSELVQHNHYKVVYTGDGADEILGGYDCFRQDYIRIWGNQKQNMQQRRRYYLDEFKGNFAKQYLQLLWHLHRPKNQRRAIARFGCYPAWFDFWHIMHDMQGDLFTDEFAQATQHDQQMPELMEQIRPHLENRHPLNQSLYLEIKTRLPDWILWKTDRMSMAHGVEARVPFLDHPLVELTARMPPRMKLNFMDEKYVLRQVMLERLPKQPHAFRKRAFYTPIREWFYTHQSSDRIGQYLSTQALEESGIFRPAEVQRIWHTLLEITPPKTMDDYYHIMRLEWVLTLVLSIQILYSQFVKKNAICFQ